MTASYRVQTGVTAIALLGLAAVDIGARLATGGRRGLPTALSALAAVGAAAAAAAWVGAGEAQGIAARVQALDERVDGLHDHLTEMAYRGQRAGGDASHVPAT